MVDILSPLYNIAGGILTTAQPVWNGGVISYMLNNVLFVNSSEKASPADHVIETIRSGGYLAGLVCGIIWSILLMIVGFGLCVCHCNRRNSESKTSVMYTIVAHRIQRKRGSMERSFACRAIQFILSDIFVLIAFIMCILAFVVNAHLNSALTSTKSEDAVIPSVARSVKNLHDYVKLLVPHARVATKPIVDDIVYNTELLQNTSRAVFSKALTKKIKGDVLQRNGIMLVNYFSVIYDSMSDIRDALEAFGKDNIEMHFQRSKEKLDKCCQTIERASTDSSSAILLKLKNKCNQIKTFYKPNTKGKIINFDPKDVKFSEAETLITLLQKENQTPKAMRAEMAVTLMKKKNIEDKLYLKSKRVLKVEENIRNMTAGQWDDLEEKISGVSGIFDNITNLLYGDVHDKVSKYEGIRNALYLLVLFLMMLTCLMCSVIYIHHFCVPGELTRRVRSACKIILYTSMIILSFIVLVCTGTFLMGGYTQTEVCRYLDERPHENGNHSAMYLDKMVNGWLNEHWSAIEAKMGNESSMPVPRPRDIFYGLATTCKANQSIMLAINALESMDMSAVSKPEMTNRFLRLGRELMHESFRNTKPSDLLRPTMKQDMIQLLKLVKIAIYKNDSYQSYLDALRKPLLLFDESVFRKDVLEFRNFVDQYKGSKGSSDISATFAVFDSYFLDSLKSVDAYKLLMKNLTEDFTQLRNHMNISAIVNPMFPAIATLSSYLNNVTKWIEDADVLYDQIIVESTKQNSPKMMADSTEKIMSVLGPCRNLYNAYKNVVFASCTVVVQSLNLMWFFMGCSVFFLTPCVVIALLILTKSLDVKPNYGENGMQPSRTSEKALNVSEKIEMTKGDIGSI